MVIEIEYKLGQLEARLENLEEQLEAIRKDTKATNAALNKGKGVLVGLVLAASGVGALINEGIKYLTK